MEISAEQAVLGLARKSTFTLEQGRQRQAHIAQMLRLFTSKAWELQGWRRRSRVTAFLFEAADRDCRNNLARVSCGRLVSWKLGWVTQGPEMPLGSGRILC